MAETHAYLSLMVGSSLNLISELGSLGVLKLELLCTNFTKICTSVPTYQVCQGAKLISLNAHIDTFLGSEKDTKREFLQVSREFFRPTNSSQARSIIVGISSRDAGVTFADHSHGQFLFPRSITSRISICTGLITLIAIDI
jgi:hypothetical protein